MVNDIQLLKELIERLEERKKQGLTNLDLVEAVVLIANVLKTEMEKPCCRD